MAFTATVDVYQFAISAKNQTKDAFDGINTDLSKVEISTAGVAKKMRELASVGAASMVGFATASAGAILAITSKTAEAAREIDNLSMVAGTNSTQFQEMAYGARLYGIEQDKLADILKDTNDKIGDFMQNGAGPMQDFFANIAPAVGVTKEQFKGLSGADALQLYVNSLEKANLSQQDMTFYMEAIASDATGLLPLLKDNGKAMADQAREAEQLGLVLNDVDIAILEETDRTLKRNKEAFGGFTNQLAVEFAPIINAVSTKFLNAAREAGGFGTIASKVFNAVVEGAAYTANVIRGLEVVWLGVKIAAAGMVEGVLLYFERIEKGVRALLQYVPGVKVSTESVIGEIRQSFTNVREDVQEKFMTLLNKPMPYEGVKTALFEIKSQAIDTANAVASVSGSTSNTNDSGGDDPQARIAQLKVLKDAEVATDAEREELAYLNRLVMLQANFENEVITKERYHEAIATQAEAFQNKLTAIEFKGLTERQKFENKSYKDKSKQVFGELANVTAGVASHNKNLFEINKAAGIANAVIATYEGVSQSLKVYPWPLAGVMAAVHLAAGLANVSAIKSQSFNSSTGSNPITNGTTSVGTMPITNAPSNLANTNASSTEKSNLVSGNTYVINIEPGSKMTDKELREMMERMAEQEGFNVRFG